METVNFQEIYDDLLNKVENNIKVYIPNIEPSELYDPFSYIMSAGGKRIRPVLTIICCGAVGGNPDDALNSGTGIEILHNFTLVHDDIMDRSPLRRNKPTVHAKWNEPTAILTGDVMVGYAYKLLPTPDDNINSSKIIEAFSNGLIEVCEGQAFDMQFNNKKDVSTDEYFLMITKKTARLLETAAVIGGYCGYGTNDQISALRRFAFSLGIAFQLQDDLLDLTANQAELGKIIGQDIVEGKKTFLVISALKKAQLDSDKLLLKKFVDENGLSKENVPAILEMFERLDILKESQDLIDEYFNKAESELYNFPQNNYKEMLRWLIKKLNKRNF